MMFGMNQNRVKMIRKQGEMWNNYRRCSAVAKEGNEDLHHFYPKRNSRGACGTVCVCDARNPVMLPEIVLFLLLLPDILLLGPLSVATFPPLGIFRSPGSSQTGLAISRAYRLS
jgi:hypothetical protein